MTRVDKQKNIAKVATSLLKDPLQTAREIADDVWKWASTVNRVRKELAQTGTKDDRILWIVDTDITNVTLGQNILQRRLQEESGKMSTKDVVSVIAEATKRATIFGWDVTDESWGLKNFDSVRVMEGFE